MAIRDLPSKNLFEEYNQQKEFVENFKERAGKGSFKPLDDSLKAFEIEIEKRGLDLQTSLDTSGSPLVS